MALSLSLLLAVTHLQYCACLTDQHKGILHIFPSQKQERGPLFRKKTFPRRIIATQLY